MEEDDPMTNASNFINEFGMDETYTVRNISLTNVTPDSLYDICANYLVDNLWAFRYELKGSGKDIVLPREICEKLFSCYQSKRKTNDSFISIFRDTRRTTLKRVCLQNSDITDDGLNIIVAHELTELRLDKCENISLKSFSSITVFARHLVILEIDVPIFTHLNTGTQKQICNLSAPCLKQLAIKQQEVVAYANILLQNLPSLTHLDFSDCLFLNNISSICGLKKLQSLILYNVPTLQDMFEWICTLENLRHLDISQSNVLNGIYVNPNQVLSRLIQSLPKLVSLDISGTNLGGNGIAESMAGEGSQVCDIPGLMDRVNNPLEFLGLYGTLKAASSRRDIPSVKITGDSNKKQIFTAAVAYLDKKNMFIKVLNDFFHLCRADKEDKSDDAKMLYIVLEGMQRHVLEKKVQISGSAILFYLVKDNKFGIKLKQRIIATIINAMENHRSDYTMMRNGCLTILSFKIPNDILFKYERLVHIVLHCITSDRTPEGLVQRLSIALLNSMACQVEEKHKKILGSCGIVSKMLTIISNRIRRHLCDEVLQVAWSTLWNVTDETHSNCKMFVDEGGLNFFLDCLKSFPQRDELLRNMMGLLGNIAEVSGLRFCFMNKRFLSVFSDLLDSDQDGIEVSYNAAGVIAHIASDGEDRWTVKDPPRQSVLNRMTDAINSWDIKTERNIHYRSFGPILELLHAHNTPESVHWALWALANLTTVYPEKYCKLLVSEKGIELLQIVLGRKSDSYILTPPMRMLAKMIIENCENVSQSSLPEDDQSE